MDDQPKDQPPDQPKDRSPVRPPVRPSDIAPPDDPAADGPIPVTRTVSSGTARLMPDIDRARAWLLTIDGAPQSYVDLEDPEHLEFEYARRVAHLIDLIAPDPVATGPTGAAARGAPLDVVHLGGGGLTLPRYTAATRPGSRQRVADSDRGLLDFVEEYLPLPPGSGITAEARDARELLDTAAAASADLVISDVYGGTRVPAHLTTLSYAHAAHRVLRPHGVYAANLADTAPFRFVGPQLATFGAVFPHLCLVAEPAVLRGRRFGNTVLVASREPLPLAALARRCAADVFPARVEHGSALARLSRGTVPVQDGDAVPSPEPPDGAFSIG